MNHFFTRFTLSALVCTFFYIFQTQAQETSSTYANKDLEAFVLIYSETSSIENNLDVEIISLLQEYNITYGRYRDIIQQNVEGKEKTGYSENEKAFFDAVQKKNTEISAKVEKFETQKCKELLLDPKVYFEIKALFRSSQKFQSEIYPYFEKQINSTPRD
jgi:hypothetical protein